MSPITGLLPGRPAESLRPRLRRDRHDPAGRTRQIHRNPRTTRAGAGSRDSKFTGPFDEVFRSEGMRIVRTPIRAPNANAYAERWVGTLRRECLDRILIVNRPHLEHVLRLYTAHYNRHRPHRSLGLQPPDQQPAAAVPVPARRIHKHELLGGLVNEYKAAA